MPRQHQLTFSFDGPPPEKDPKSRDKPSSQEKLRRPGKKSSIAKVDDLRTRKCDSAPPTSTHRRSALLRGRHLDQELTERSRNLLESIGLSSLAHQVQVLWNTRLQTTAGMADGRKQEVTLNPRLLDIDPGELEGTLRHELAHLVAYHRAGGRRIQAHGGEWRAACADLGIPDEKRCHELPFKSRRRRPKFAYQCKHCETVYPRTRRLRRYSACYSCCRAYNRGRYSNKFLLKEVGLEMLPPQENET